MRWQRPIYQRRYRNGRRKWLVLPGLGSSRSQQGFAGSRGNAAAASALIMTDRNSTNRSQPQMGEADKLPSGQWGRRALLGFALAALVCQLGCTAKEMVQVSGRV